MISLNTGFETSQAGLSESSKIALNISIPAALADDLGILKRKVLEPDEYPRVGLDLTSPPNIKIGNVAASYPRQGVNTNVHKKVRSSKTHDGKSLTA